MELAEEAVMCQDGIFQEQIFFMSNNANKNTSNNNNNNTINIIINKNDII